MAELDANKLAERLGGLQRGEYWLHLEAASPLEKYPAKQHARRVQQKLGLTSGLIYLPGEPALNNEDSDMPAPFRQRRYFYYLSGCNEPNCHLTYDIQRDILALFIPRINPERVIWTGRGSTPAEALDKYDIDEVYFADELQPWLQAWSATTTAYLYVLHPSQSPAVPGLILRTDATLLQPAMNLTRVIKDDHEVGLIRKANDISSHAHKQVLANILRFKNEAQVEGLFLDVCVSKQAKQQAYAPIAASGPNAGTLHYDANNEDFEDRQLMCLDAGCEYELYASDITRTFPLSGSWPSKESENIYKLVQRMQETCIERLAPGVRYLDLHILAHQIAIDGLLQLGILHNGTKEEIYKAGTSRAFFPHGLGHHVGLEVHDIGQKELMSAMSRNPKYEKAPSLYPENFHLPVYDEEMCRVPTNPESPHLEEGMVVTVEPGIYFSTYALSYFYLPSPVHSKYINTEVVNRYLPVGGVRIEDDILITTKGHENLTAAPKGEAMLEIIRTQNAHRPPKSRFADPGSVRRRSIQQKELVEEEPLLRAPGIPRFPPEPILKPIMRASTEPVKPKDRKSADFEPFDGPSLFSGFERTTTTDENVERWKASLPVGAPQAAPEDGRMPLCREMSPALEHAYESPEHGIRNSFLVGGKKPICAQCRILLDVFEDLKKTLRESGRIAQSGQSEPQVTTSRTFSPPKEYSPAPVCEHWKRFDPDTTGIPSELRQERLPQTQERLGNCGLPSRNSAPADRADSRRANTEAMGAPEISQRRSIPPEPIRQRPIPSGLPPLRSNLAELPHRRSIPAELPQRRSVTFDNYPLHPRASVNSLNTPRPNPWHPTAQLPAINATSGNPWHTQLPSLPPDLRRSPSPTPEIAPRPMPAASRTQTAARETPRFHPFTRTHASRASLPALRPQQSVPNLSFGQTYQRRRVQPNTTVPLTERRASHNYEMQPLLPRQSRTHNDEKRTTTSAPTFPNYPGMHLPTQDRNPYRGPLADARVDRTDRRDNSDATQPLARKDPFEGLRKAIEAVEKAHAEQQSGRRRRRE